jgi:hypothetical protein
MSQPLKRLSAKESRLCASSALNELKHPNRQINLGEVSCGVFFESTRRQSCYCLLGFFIFISFTGIDYGLTSVSLIWSPYTAIYMPSSALVNATSVGSMYF